MFQENIIKWYPIEKNKTVIQIGDNAIITDELKNMSKNVKCISSIGDIDFELRYDYVIIYGFENYYNNLQKIVELLNENGKLLIIGDNKFGISKWSKYVHNEEKGVSKLEKHNDPTKDISQIKEELKQLSLTELNTFYVFPNYKMAEIIINEKFNVEKGHIEKYNPIIEENEIRVFDENKVLKNIIANKPEMLEFFANSYFIEASKEKINTDVKLVSYNNARNEQYRLITIIQNDIVKKIPATSSAKKHISNMKKIISNIKECEIDILDYEHEGAIYSEFIKNTKTLDEILNSNYDNLEYIVDTLNGIKEILVKNSIPYNECEKQVELKGLQIEGIEKLHFMKNAFWDMIPKNCFYINNKYVFFDQEWEKEYLPIEFIIYRSVINCYDLVRKINVDELLEKLGILQYKEYFQILDEQLRKQIINEKIYTEIYSKKIDGIDNLINDKKIAEMCKMQIEEDNKNKQTYIDGLETYIEELKKDNKLKQDYIDNLEKSNENKQKHIKELEERKKPFWKR